MIALELGFGALLVGFLALLAGPLHPVTLEATGVTGLFALLLHLLPRGRGLGTERLHYVVRYGFLLWAFLGTARFVPALSRPLADATLLSVDRAIFGETPALRFDLARHPRLAELFSAAYLTYQPYLHGCFLWALLKPEERGERLARPVFTTLVLGYVGYLLVPAVGPFVALPSFVASPLVGGPLARLNLDIVNKGGAVFDVFPSLHTAVTLVLLRHDWKHARRRFYVLAPVAILLIPSTMLLRMHYAVDVMAGALLAAGVLALEGRGRAGPSLQGSADLQREPPLLRPHAERARRCHRADVRGGKILEDPEPHGVLVLETVVSPLGRGVVVEAVPRAPLAAVVRPVVLEEEGLLA